MDVLVALGACSAYLYSVAAIFLGYETYFDTAATIITLVTLGRYIELCSKQKARGNIANLLTLIPPFARLIQPDGSVALVPLTQIKTNSRIQVLAGDKIPVDGKILAGSAGIDEAMLTGESIPRQKGVSDIVYAGTINISGTLEISTTEATKTVLAQIVATIESADVQKTKLVQLVNKVIGYFVPIVLAIAAGSFVALYFVLTVPMSEAIMRAIAVIVVACPCALGLAVPMAATAAIGSAASLGAIIKNGNLLASLRNVEMICLDKTGTLTAGKPTIAKYRSSDARFIMHSALLEAHSSHVLAKAIAGTIREYLPVKDVHEEAGCGITGMVDGCLLKVGRYDYVTDTQETDNDIYKEMLADAKKGYSIVCVGIEGRFAGYYALIDPLRQDVQDAMPQLRAQYGVALLSGDSEATVANIAKELRIGYRAELSPFDKIDIIRAYQQDGHRVLMVGDGINDAAALKQADASIAMGQTAADIAVDSADAVLMRADLGLVTRLIELARRTDRIIKQNLGWSFAYNVVAIPLAAAGIIHPVASAICMSISSVIVVMNSTRAKV
jgi:heavy metal translocating P-type ATPase